MARRRPVRLLVPDSGPILAPYVAACGTDDVALSGEGLTVRATYDGSHTGRDSAVALQVTRGGHTKTYRSRRAGRPRAAVDELALALTGPWVTAFTREGETWTARARVDLAAREPIRGKQDYSFIHDADWLAGLQGSGNLGRFGQLGLRDLRAVTHADGTPYTLDGRALLTATSAGPGGFRTGHCSVWSLDPTTFDLEHRADLYTRRGPHGRVYGDHAVHLVRDGERWLLASSTWGDFDRRTHPVGVTLAETTADLTCGAHVLDARPWHLPTDGLRSVGVWDPHLVRTGDGWLVGYVSAVKYFEFHPVLASGPDLDNLRFRGAGTGPETEGTTLARLGGQWRVLASDRRQHRYPVLDVDMRQVGALDAHYPTNIPWPTLIALPDVDLLVGFNGTPYGGPLVDYGSHGEVVVQRRACRAI